MRLHARVFALAPAAALVLVAALPDLASPVGWLPRAAVLAVWLAVVAIQLRCGRLDLLLSPLLLLGGSAVVLYSVVPNALAFLLTSSGTLDKIAAFLGSPAESLVLAFALAATLAHASLLASRPAKLAISTPVAGRWVAGFSGITLAGTATAPFVLPNSFAHTVLQASLPVMLAALVWLSASAVGRVRLGGLTVAALASAAGVALIGGKAALITPVALLPLGLAILRPSLRRASAVTGIAITVLVAVAGLHFATRQSLADIGAQRDTALDTALAAAENVLDYKVIIRQGDTGTCLQGVVARHLDRPGEGSALFFFGGLVPRFLWPGKPSLSLGAYYATTYCTSSPGGAKFGHSASITLLGQPIIRAGGQGLRVAVGFLLAVLLGGTLFAMRSAPVGMVVLTGMLPWLCDFDQDFALYVANAVRALLLVMPLAALLGWFIPGRDVQ